MVKIMKLKPKNAVITQQQLARYVKLKEAEKELELLKSQIVDAHLGGAKVEDGPLVCAVDVTYRSNVKWKEEFIRIASESVAEEITANAPKSMVRSLKVFDSLQVKR